MNMLDECAMEMKAKGQLSQSTSPHSEADYRGDNGLPELQHPVTISKSDGICSQSCEEIQGWPTPHLPVVLC